MLVKDIIVTTSTELNSTQKSSLEPKLKSKFGDLPILYIVDTNLLLGLKIVVADQEYRYDLESELSFIMNRIKS